MAFQCINIRQVPREVLKTTAFGLGFQHLPRDLANVNAWKTMFDPYTLIWPDKVMFGPADEKRGCTYAHSKDPDQPLQPRSLVEVFAVRLYNIRTLLEL